MSASQQSQATTRMFARVIGPFLTVVTATALVRAPELWTHVRQFSDDPLWTWVGGAFTLLAGLVVVAAHPYWRGVAAISVSALGWLTALKGFALVAFPATLTSFPAVASDAPNWWRAGYALFVLLGLYLTYVGWAPIPRRPARQGEGASADLPHAA